MLFSLLPHARLYPYAKDMAHGRHFFEKADSHSIVDEYFRVFIGIINNIFKRIAFIIKQCKQI